MMEEKIKADLQAIISQGHDPAAYRMGLAGRHHVSVDVIDAAIAGLVLRDVDPETVALERLMDDRRMKRAYPTAYRAANHEEA